MNEQVAEMITDMLDTSKLFAVFEYIALGHKVNDVEFDIYRLEHDLSEEAAADELMKIVQNLLEQPLYNADGIAEVAIAAAAEGVNLHDYAYIHGSHWTTNIKYVTDMSNLNDLDYLRSWVKRYLE